MIDILQTDKVFVRIFATLVAGAISEGRFKGKSSQVNYFFNNPGKWLCQLIMGQSIGENKEHLFLVTSLSS